MKLEKAEIEIEDGRVTEEDEGEWKTMPTRACNTDGERADTCGI